MHVLALRLALNHLKSQPLSRLVVVASVACILLMNAMVFLLFQSFSRTLAEVRSAHFMTAYLDSAVLPAREPEIVSAIKKIPGVGAAQLVSRDVFLENFSKYFPLLTNELAALETDVIPRYVKVKVDSSLLQSTGAAPEEQVLRKVREVRGIELVEPNQNRFAGLIGALSTLRRLALVLIIGMSTALLCILLNHFKLGSAFQAQVRSTLTLLGAKRAFVFLPFAIEGLIEGLAGGAIAAGALLLYGHAFESQLNGMFTAIGYHPYHFELAGLAVALAAAGMLAGMAGSLWAAARAVRH